MKIVRLRLKDAITYALMYDELKLKKHKTPEELKIFKISEALRKGRWKVV